MLHSPVRIVGKLLQHEPADAAAKAQELLQSSARTMLRVSDMGTVMTTGAGCGAESDNWRRPKWTPSPPVLAKVSAFRGLQK